mmetsp:Transcript_722/g.2376  ORF Transcript_722/g.2376 Transcript_722/m.2376 type:complete len:97 (-) Transcript_722:130-420(-)|eukprot:CAMPEP_0198729752 /NCGR_PEP_ID=MMETSP1475-20131203/20828_1 /TAXON_ID= ORGANISM="Unidentified sp., Strain CCMP1999" /NCGR_SAMPLE_ID=MMETSP1475 /ASSEMBLY_ACC=CAM_ASM_001111 /LENGTH=96 /DNA_ID=CAMNT_0044492453 /DNA_START=68 /DNA_END=358 /DNA_ORIENTATION=-
MMIKASVLVLAVLLVAAAALPVPRTENVTEEASAAGVAKAGTIGGMVADNVAGGEDKPVLLFNYLSPPKRQGAPVLLEPIIAKIAAERFGTDEDKK